MTYEFELDYADDLVTVTVEENENGIKILETDVDPCFRNSERFQKAVEAALEKHKAERERDWIESRLC